MWWARPDAGGTRVRPVAARRLRRAAVPLCALTLLPTACGGPAGPARAIAPGTLSPTVTTHRPAPTPRPVPTACEEPEPDGGPVDLTSVTLDRSPDGLVVTFDLRGPAITSFDVLALSVGLWGPDGTAQRSLGVRWVHGDPTLVVYDVGQADETDLPGRPTVSGGTVTVRFPASATAELGPVSRWEAYASVNGTLVDECPSG